MNNNCPANCYHCSEESIEETNERGEEKQMREEDDANFADQDD